jgi:high-affinity Fe2+/Pb2+ permease
VSKPHARQTELSGVSGYETSIPRCLVAAGLVVVGIVWIIVYVNLALDAAHYDAGSGLPAPSNPLPLMADLGDWNFTVGFGLIFLGLIVSANKKTPMGRGRGVVIGMLGCFLIGLVWVVVFYFVGTDTTIPVMRSLGQKNLVLGVCFMAVGFAFATKWE